MSKPRVSVVLNVFKRSEYFEKQILAIKAQTIQPIEIFVWENGNESVPVHLRDGLTICRSSQNFGVWSRFAFALNTTGDFVCVFDDDTIPGDHWLENCVTTIQDFDGLLGTRGVIFDSNKSYTLNRDVGVHAPNEHATQVDIVGHSWFFRREWLAYYWGEYTNAYSNRLVGEDIHFSYSLQKQGISTFVPPHPISDKRFWGSNPELAIEIGTNSAAISKSPGNLRKFELALQHYQRLGFRVLSESENVPNIGKTYVGFFALFIRRFPEISHKAAKAIRSVRLLIRSIRSK